MKILVVEDEPSIRSNITRLLRIEGFEPIAVENGRLGLETARRELPTLILSDVMMPELDGFGLLTALRADPLTASIPVILLTARADQTDVRSGMNLGADDYLAKPFQREDLLQAVRSQIAKAETQRGVSAKLAAEARRAMDFDALTGLPNRSYFLERLNDALHSARRANMRAAVAVVGLDGFSRINAGEGREVGDAVLREIGDRLSAAVVSLTTYGTRHLVARLGGDEYAVLIDRVFGQQDTEHVVQGLANALSRPVIWNDSEHYLSGSIGIAMYPEDADASTNLLSCAEIALANAKTAGGKAYRFFAPEMNAAASERLRLHNDLHRGIEQREFVLHYQPQVHIATGRVIGVEALMRWRHGKLGMVSPASFIPVAENNGLIVQLGAWALREACRQAAEWYRAGHSIRMGVNLAAQQFADDGLPETVRKALKESGLPPALLELEITEGTAMHHGERSVALMHRMKALGVRLAIDDFGTGFSSLSYLKQFPLDVLKIDQSFVRNLTTDSGDAAIVSAVNSLAKSFGMKVIAEGVETQQQLDHLHTLGCDEMQGYLFSKPMPGAEVFARFAETAPLPQSAIKGSQHP